MTSEDAQHSGLRRVLREVGDLQAIDRLGSLSGSDLTTFLLELMRRRAARATPPRVLRQYQRDRFVAPGQTAFRDLRRAEDLCVQVLQAAFEFIVLAPTAPFAAHACLGGISQDRVVSGTRNVEVAGDPTMGLALEAAVRRADALRRDPHSDQPVRLAAFQRVLRAQAFAGPRSFSHFELLGLVSAARDRGGYKFEANSLAEHISVLAAVMRAAGASDVVVRLTDFSGQHGLVLTLIEEQLGDLQAERWDGRQAGRDYYPTVCFKIDGRWGEELVEIADGGIVQWTKLLLGSAKERLVTSGLSVERVAAVIAGA